MLSGQPQFLPMAWQTAMYWASKSGLSSRSTLMQTNAWFSRSATSWSLKHSCFHDVAPVARSVAYAEENGFVFSFRSIEGFLAPRVPVYWVVGVLEKVRAFFIYQPVRLLFMIWLQKMDLPTSIMSLRLLLTV